MTFGLWSSCCSWYRSDFNFWKPGPIGSFSFAFGWVQEYSSKGSNKIFCRIFEVEIPVSWKSRALADKNQSCYILRNNSTKMPDCSEVFPVMSNSEKWKTFLKKKKLKKKYFRKKNQIVLLIHALLIKQLIGFGSGLADKSWISTERYLSHCWYNCVNKSLGSQRIFFEEEDEKTRECCSSVGKNII